MKEYTIYTKAYEAGRNDVLAEARFLKAIMYGDVCAAMEGLKATGEISEDAHKRVMKQIDILFSEEVD